MTFQLAPESWTNRVLDQQSFSVALCHLPSENVQKCYLSIRQVIHKLPSSG